MSSLLLLSSQWECSSGISGLSEWASGAPPKQHSSASQGTDRPNGCNISPENSFLSLILKEFNFFLNYLYLFCMFCCQSCEILFKLPLFFRHLSLSTIFCRVSTLDLGPKYYQLQDKIHLWVCCCGPLIQKLLSLIHHLSCSHGLRKKQGSRKHRQTKNSKKSKVATCWHQKTTKHKASAAPWYELQVALPAWEVGRPSQHVLAPHCDRHPTEGLRPQSYYQLVPAAYVMVKCIESCFIMEGGRTEDRIWIYWQFLIHNCVYGPQSVWQSTEIRLGLTGL